jgi:hypothetical protein
MCLSLTAISWMRQAVQGLICVCLSQLCVACLVKRLLLLDGLRSRAAAGLAPEMDGWEQGLGFRLKP